MGRGGIWAAGAVLCAIASGWTMPAHGQSPDHASRPQLRAVRVVEPIEIDGVLDEAAWASATGVGGLVQLDPDEGQPASEATEVKVLLGADALYIGARLLDREIGTLHHREGRRDDSTAADGFAVELDPLHDHLHGFRFQVGPDGTLSDAVISSTGQVDRSWDAVWQARATIDSLGWTVEMRIPLSQLRFNRSREVWGIQFERFLLRRLERSYFAFTPKRILPSGGMNPAYYGHLTGLTDLPSTQRLELLPYVSLGASFVHDAAAGPTLRNPSGQYSPRVGGDTRIGLGSDITLNATINPDFGQVEVDPAVVNLTAFETQFPEKRPFFVEGADRFDFGNLRAWETVGRPTVFYSRRVGRAPQLSAFRDTSVAFADAPERTDILGALKLIGRSRGGWTLAALEALTSREQARTLSPAGIPGRVSVEPLTNYFVGRVARDLRGGETTIGGLLTRVDRRLDDPVERDQLAGTASVGGLELSHTWARRTWGLDAYLSGSAVSGAPGAMIRLQSASARYFQRPDARHDHLDSTRTRLEGYDAEVALTRLTGNWVGSVAYQDISPGYETNDAGLLFDAGRRNVSLDLHYQHFEPGKLFRNYIIWPFTDHTWNYDGQMVRNKFNFYFQAELLNRWQTGWEYDYIAPVMDDRLTRGGPMARAPGVHHLYYRVATPQRKRVSLATTGTLNLGADGARNLTWKNGIVIQARSNLQLRIDPLLTLDREPAQFIGRYRDSTATRTFGARTVFARLDQRSVGLETRVDWVLARRLTLQLYSQGLISANRFNGYQSLSQPGTFSFDRYGVDIGTLTTGPAGEITVDADGSGPAPSFTTDRPDFTLRSLRVNAVLRWEFRPGSTLFAAWTHQSGGRTTLGNLELGRDVDGLFGGPADNVLAIKAAYWLAW